jgi:anti-anti-sigma factor
VVLDFAALTFIDSAAIGAIVGAHRRMTAKGGELLVINPGAGTRRVFKLLGLGWLVRDPAQALIIAERADSAADLRERAKQP